MIYDISYKTFIGAKPLHISFDKIDGFIKIYDETRYLVLLGPERYDAISDKIKYFIIEKSGIRSSINHNFARIRMGSYNSFLKEKKLAFHNVIILIKPVFNKNKNKYYYNIFLRFV